MKKERGITLIALIITIIIMLILVAVTVSIIINSGIIGKAQTGTQETRRAYDEESRIGETINVDGVEYTLDEYLNSLNEDGGLLGAPKDKNGLVIASGTDTTPFLPDDTSEITNNDLNTGLTVKDSNGNEWVWIEVPTSIYTNSAYNTESTTGDMEPANSEDYEKIRYCLETYAKTLIPEGTSYKNTKNGFRDYWYYMPSYGTVYSKDPLTGDQYLNDAANSDDISSYTDAETPDGTKGTGLNFSQYETKYKAMLKSTYENGGFYIGKYETGTETARGASSDALTTAVIKENAYPYNYVSLSQAEAKAEELAPSGKTTSLLFGVQWDLVLKHLSNKGVSDSLLNYDSSTWGNYNNKAFTIDRGKYSTAEPYNVFIDYTTPTANKVTYENGISTKIGTTGTDRILLTTGASDNNSRYNIYDLAGNVSEMTLEKSSYSFYPCTTRSTSMINEGLSFPASYRSYTSLTASSWTRGFRCSLY